ncbi:MAG: ankyrin repeat domain-containing protein, partial [Myxococcota bacterium]
GDLARIEAFLALDCPTETLDDHGFRPLHLACAAGHVEVVRELLAAGAHPNAASSHPGCFEGLRPPHAAVAGDHLEVVELLLSHGARVDATDEAGFTPLHLAVACSTRPVVRRLLAAGADPRREVADTSPVQLALRRGARDLAALLRQVARMSVLRVG